MVAFQFTSRLVQMPLRTTRKLDRNSAKEAKWCVADNGVSSTGASPTKGGLASGQFHALYHPADKSEYVA